MAEPAPRPRKPTHEDRERALLARVELVRRIHRALEAGELDPDDPGPWLASEGYPGEESEHWHRVVANTAERLQGALGRMH